MTFYAIRNEDGSYLPVGGTKAEFSHTLPPRLFRSAPTAATSLSFWCEGHYHLMSYAEDECPMPEPLDTAGNRSRSAKRKAMNIKIVPVELVLK